MRRRNRLIIFMTLTLAMAALTWDVGLLTAQISAEETQLPLSLSRDKKTQSYAIGVGILRDFGRQGFDFELGMVQRGMADAAAGGKLLWSEEIIMTTQRMTLSELKQKQLDSTTGLPRQELERRELIAQQENNTKQIALLAENRAKAGEESQESKNKREMQSYAMGVEILRNFHRQQFDFDLDLLLRGMTDAAGGKLQMSEDHIAVAQRMVGAELKYKRGQYRGRMGQDNLKAGREFLAANRTKEGVVALPSGLQYRIVKAGDGTKPTDTDTVEFRYRGTHLDGAEFDNFEQSGQSAVLKKVAEVIPGWREALQLMSVGSKWQLFIPPELAYGQRGAGKIGPYETTVYEIELVAIK